MTREQTIICDLCGSRVLKAHAIEGVCRNCHRILSVAEDPSDRLSKGEVPQWLRDFLPEIASVFEGDWRFGKYYKVADEIIFKSAFGHGGGDFPVGDLLALPESQAYRERIFRVLHAAGLASLDGDTVRLGSLGKRVCELLPAGADWGSPEIKGIQEEMRGWITFLLAKSLIDAWQTSDHEFGRPRNFLVVMSYLCRLWDFPDAIPKTVRGAELFSPDEHPFGLRQSQLIRLLQRIIGLGGRYPKLFERSYDRSDIRVGYLDLDLKPQTHSFIEMERERYRERERERGR